MKIASVFLVVLLLTHFVTPAGATGWKVIGPGGGGGQFLPTINPLDPENVLVSCDMTGAYVTHDSGVDWNTFNFGTSVKTYAFDPYAPGVVYAASVGLFRSQDNGRSWRRIFPAGQDVTTVYQGDHADPVLIQDGNPVPTVTAIRPVSARTIWLGHRDGSISVSEDAGVTWISVPAKLDSSVIGLFPGAWWGESGVIAVTASQVGVIDEQGNLKQRHPLVAEEALQVRGGFADGVGLLYAVTSKDVFLSSDAGKTWESILSPPLYEGARFRTIAVSEGNPNVAYLGCTSTPFGIFRTDDAGKSWRWVYKVVESAESNQRMTIKKGDYDGAWLDQSYGPGWREYPLDLGVSPTNPDICYVTDFGSTYRTLDGGDNWQQVYSIDHGDGSFTSRGLNVTTCYGVHFDPFDQDHLFVSYTDVGAFYSDDDGKSWRHGADGIPREWSNTCYWAVFDPSEPGRIWSVWGNKHDIPRDKMFRRGDFLRRAQGGVAISDDGGRSWSPFRDNGIPRDAVCTHIVLDPNSPKDARTLYVTAFQKGIFKSVDGGENWSRLPEPPTSNQNYYRLSLLPNGALYVLVARDRLLGKDGEYTDTDGGLFCSLDKGESWERVELPSGANFPTELKWDPTDPDRLYLSLWPHAGADGGEVFDTGGGVLVSEDAGETWKRIFDQSSFISGMTVHPADPERLYIVTFQGAAFTSNDRGATWRRIDGYDFKWGHHPFINPHKLDQLYITTFGGSVWTGPATPGLKPTGEPAQ